MTATDWIAILALIISSGTFALEFKRWFDAGPRIQLSVMADAVMFPDDDGRHKLVLTVTNRGDAPTLVTHVIVATFPNRWRFWRRKPDTLGFVNSSLQPIPSQIGVNESFLGMFIYDEASKKARADGKLYAGVVCSHSNKKFLVQVPRQKPDVKATKAGT